MLGERIINGRKQYKLSQEDLAEKIVNLTQRPSNFKFAYELNETIEEKISSVAKKYMELKM